jgi:hypothetical protein
MAIMRCLFESVALRCLGSNGTESSCCNRAATFSYKVDGGQPGERLIKWAHAMQVM